MTISALLELTGAKLLTPEIDQSREISIGYSCDMLSWVMAHAEANMAWITVQSHMNVIAVATMMDMSCVIIPEGIEVNTEIIEKAAEEELALIVSGLTAYELCGRMYAAGIGAQKG